MRNAESHIWKIILIPCSWLYGAVVWIRNMLFDQGILPVKEFHIPIISVGNITVGGTGKTPHVEYLAELLSHEFRVAILSRGYLRRSRGFRMASAGSGFREIGDEPMQMKQRFPELTVAVDRKRVHGVTRLMELEPPLEVLLLDDAYQHRYIKPGFSILLIDFNRPVTKDRLLPAGRLREPAGNRDRAQVILVTRSPERMKPIEMREYVKGLNLPLGQHLFFTSFRYGELFPVYPEVTKRDLQWFKENTGGVLILTGIANPRPLRQFARTLHTRFSEICYPDHHRYTRKDLERISRRFHAMKEELDLPAEKSILILTTEKDAMRLREHDPEARIKEALHAVRIHVHFLNNDKSAFDQQITNYVRSNRRSSILHQK